MPDPKTPPFTGAHGFQVFVFIPTTKSPWRERFDWLKKTNRFQTHGQWVSVTGPVVGVLNPNYLVETCRPGDDCPILVVVPQLLAFPPGKDQRMETIKTEPSSSSATVAPPAASVASPSTPTPKRVSRNTWASPNKAQGSTTNRTPARQGPASTATDIKRHEALDGSDDTLSGDLPTRSPPSVVAPAEDYIDVSKVSNDATEVVLGMSSFLFCIPLPQANIV